MARRIAPLTNTQVSQAKPKDKEYNLSDGDGLMLRVKPSGTKTWLFNYYRPFTKKRANMSFGSFPDLSIANAREKRKEARELLARNIDPQKYRDELNLTSKLALETTFGKLADSWIELKRTQVKATTADKAWLTMEKHILPSLKNVPIHEVKPKMVIDVIRPIANRGALETVKRLCRNINEVMRLAVAAGHLETNYLADITKLFPAPQKRHMATIKPERLPELMQALANASISKNTRCLVEWQLHTMTRPIEAATARWSDLDIEKQVWVIPAERMKMNKPHTIPLSPQVLALLGVIRAMSGHREFLFPNHRDPRSHASSQSANMALKRMGFAGELVSHGLRSLASTTLNEQGFDPYLIEACLAHVDKNEVRAAYNRAEYIERRRKIMCWWSERIEQAAAGNTSLAASKQGLSIVSNLGG
ncbi:MAG: integrase [Oleiphilus sp.]|nr:MAG: integrase [Oleiphilus sp.]